MSKDIFGNEIENLETSMAKRATMDRQDYTNKIELAQKLMNTKGHPLQTYTAENKALLTLIEELINSKDDIKKVENLFEKIRDVSIHYAEKGDIIYPLLKEKYEIVGPNTVMWTEDDVIRDDLSKLAKDNNHNEEWLNALLNVLKRVENMANKEENILFPICAVNFSNEEWHQIYREEAEYNDAFGIHSEIWDDVKEKKATTPAFNGKIIMPGGELSVEEITAILNTIPMEITFVDIDDTNQFFNEGEKLFKRPSMSLGRKVYSCHPPKIEAMVKNVIASFKSGEKDNVQIWSNKQGKPMCVTYFAVRNKDGKYIGTMELCQDMTFAKNHFEGE